MTDFTPQELKSIQQLPDEGTRTFLKWCLMETFCSSALDSIEDADAFHQAFEQQAALLAIEPSDWQLVLSRQVVTRLAPFRQDDPLCAVFCKHLLKAGLRHPKQVQNSSDLLSRIVAEVLGSQSAEQQAQLVRTILQLSEFYVLRGAVTLKEALEANIGLACTPIFPLEFKDICRLEDKPEYLVQDWVSCDADIEECMSQLPETKRLFPRNSSLQELRSYGDFSPQMAWALAPSEIVNIGLRYLAYQTGQDEPHQWKRTSTGRPEETLSKQATEEPEFVLKAGAGGAIVSAYCMASGLMWQSDSKPRVPPPYTTHPTSVVCGREPSDVRRVAAYELVKIHNSKVTDENAELVQQVYGAIKQLVDMCLTHNIKYMLLGNGVYTWAAKWENNTVYLSRPYRYFRLSGESLVKQLGVGQVAFMISYKAVQEAGCPPWPSMAELTAMQTAEQAVTSAVLGDTDRCKPQLVESYNTSPLRTAAVIKQHDEIQQDHLTESHRQVPISSKPLPSLKSVSSPAPVQARSSKRARLQ